MSNTKSPTPAAQPHDKNAHSDKGFNTKRLAAKCILLSVALGGLSTISLAAPQSRPCETPPGGIMFVTQDCIDPEFANPVIDSREDLKSPVPTHRVSGHFEGTDVKFSFFFPPKAQWKGRFFQVP